MFDSCWTMSGFRFDISDLTAEHEAWLHELCTAHMENNGVHRFFFDPRQWSQREIQMYLYGMGYKPTLEPLWGAACTL